MPKRFYLGTVAILMSLLLAVPGCQGYTSEAESHYRTGISYGRNGHYQEAIPEYTKAIELDPEYLNAYRARGEAYHLLDQHEKAIADLSKVVELDPAHVEALFFRGKSYYRAARHDLAILDFTRVIELTEQPPEGRKYPSVYRPQSYDFRGCIYYFRWDYEKAVAEFNVVIGMAPRSYDTVCRRAYTYIKKGDYEQALAEFTSEIDMAKGRQGTESYQAMGYLFRGWVLARAGREAEAKADIAQAVKLNAALSNLGQAVLDGLSGGRVEQALPPFPNPR